MGWLTVAEVGSVAELEANPSYFDDLPAGGEIFIRLQTQLPVASIFNLYGSEWFAQRLIDASIEVTDVSSPDTHTIDIRGIVRGSPLVAIVAAIVAICAVIAIFYVFKITVMYYANEQAKQDLVEQMMVAGYTPEQIANILKGLGAANDPFAALLKALPWVVAGLGIVLVAPAVVNMLPKKSSK